MALHGVRVLELEGDALGKYGIREMMIYHSPAQKINVPSYEAP